MRPETVLKDVVRIEKVTHERQVNSRQYRIEKSVRREELDERREEKKKREDTERQTMTVKSKARPNYREKHLIT